MTRSSWSFSCHRASLRSRRRTRRAFEREGADAETRRLRALRASWTRTTRTRRRSPSPTTSRCANATAATFEIHPRGVRGRTGGGASSFHVDASWVVVVVFTTTFRQDVADAAVRRVRLRGRARPTTHAALGLRRAFAEGSPPRHCMLHDHERRCPRARTARRPRPRRGGTTRRRVVRQKHLHRVRARGVARPRGRPTPDSGMSGSEDALGGRRIPGLRGRSRRRAAGRGRRHRQRRGARDKRTRSPARITRSTAWASRRSPRGGPAT